MTSRVRWACAAVVWGLAACLSNAPPDPVWAPTAEGPRLGVWLGGPEPVSGKLRSGVVTYHRWDAVPVKPLRVVRLALRFEAVSGPDATVALVVGDGARWVDDSPKRWQLKPGVPSQIAVDIALPDGESYLHVTTSQQQRSSVKSILLVPPAAVKADAPMPSASAPADPAGPNPAVR